MTNEQWLQKLHKRMNDCEAEIQCIEQEMATAPEEGVLAALRVRRNQAESKLAWLHALFTADFQLPGTRF